METFVASSIKSGVGQITLSRPEKRNALTREFIEQLSVAVEELSGDPSLRVLILRAQGSVFCAGMDLGEMQKRAQSEAGTEEWQTDSKVYAKLLLSLYRLAVPTIAVMQGPALAGGVGLILTCDFVVASDNAFVMLPEPARGITAAIVAPFLIHRIGAGAATQLLLSGDRMSADRALELGLAYVVAKPDELQSRVDWLVKSIMTGSKSALAITKRHLQACSGAALDEQIKMSIGVSAEARETADAREGLAAFLEKRNPNWQHES